MCKSGFLEYYDEDAVYVTSPVSNNTYSGIFANFQVWQANPVITYEDVSGTSYKEATTNATIDYANSQITITDDNAVITVGGYAQMTINDFPANTTVYVTIGDSPETEVDLYTRTKLVSYNYDEATGTDVTIRVEADYGYLINNQYEYTKDDSMNAHKTVTFHADTSVLSNPDFVTSLPTVVQGFALTLKADTGGHITIAQGKRANGTSLVGTVIAAGTEQTYEVTAGTTFRLEEEPDDATAYEFDKWLPINSAINPKSFTITSTTTYEASFVELYSFNLTANPHSTLTVTDHNGDEVASLDGGTMGQTTILPVRSDLSEAERTFTCTMSAESGYVPYWNNDPTDDDTTTSKTVVVSGNTSISTNADKLYTLTVVSDGNGTVAATYPEASAALVDEGTDANNNPTYTVRKSKAGDVLFTLTATPNATYLFTNWTDAGGTELSTDNPYSFSLTSSVTATANFEQGRTINITDQDAAACWVLWAWESGKSGKAIIISDTPTMSATGLLENKYNNFQVFRINPDNMSNINENSSYSTLDANDWAHSGDQSIADATKTVNITHHWNNFTVSQAT